MQFTHPSSIQGLTSRHLLVTDLWPNPAKLGDQAGPCPLEMLIVQGFFLKVGGGRGGGEEGVGTRGEGWNRAFARAFRGSVALRGVMSEF